MGRVLEIVVVVVAGSIAALSLGGFQIADLPGECQWKELKLDAQTYDSYKDFIRIQGEGDAMQYLEENDVRKPLMNSLEVWRCDY